MHHHRNSKREKTFDNSRPIEIIKDLEKEKLSSNEEKHETLLSVEKELNEVLEYYERRRKVEIPKGKIINLLNGNITINNNLIYNNENKDNNLENQKYIINYNYPEYKRPDNYIIYSSELKNKINSTKKIYEAKSVDNIYLKIRQNPMDIGEFENIIIDLENNAINEKDEKVNEEDALDLINKKYSRYKNISESLINHFKDRRNTSKKSLLRKKWHMTKSTDKYLKCTFKRRDLDKIKTRKNIQNKEESLKKIEDAEKNCKNYLLTLLEDMLKREKANQELIRIDEFIFQAECDKLKQNEIPPHRIKENTILKEDIEKSVKLLDSKVNKENNKINKPIITTIVPNTNPNNTKRSLNSMSNITIKPKLDQIQTNNVNNINTQKKIIQPLNDSINNKKEKKFTKIIKSEDNENMPNLSLNSLCNDNDDINKVGNINKNELNFRLRIRYNRNNKIAIDRYIEEKNDLNPFHDSYNNIINNYQRYGKNSYNYLDDKNFQNLFDSYNLSKIKYLDLLYDSDDNSSDTNSDIKLFSNSYKHYLKMKRSHS